MKGYFDYDEWALPGSGKLRDIRSHLVATVAKGYAFVPCAVAKSTLTLLTQEVCRLEFSPCEATLNGVAQHFDHWTSPLPAPHSPLITGLGNEIHREVRQTFGSILQTWEPNDVAVQRYPTGNVGIDPHRDFKADRLLVAVVNVLGEATFNILEDDRRTARDHFLLEPGDLVLLAGAGMGETERPVHSVTNVRGERISLAYRMAN